MKAGTGTRILQATTQAQFAEHALNRTFESHNLGAPALDVGIYYAEITVVGTSGGGIFQRITATILSGVDKTAYGLTIPGIIVIDDSALPLSVGQRVTISVEAGDVPKIISSPGGGAAAVDCVRNFGRDSWFL